MPFETVSIHETYELITPIGSLWRKRDAVYRLEEGETEYEARDKVKAFIDESHAKYYSGDLPKALPPKTGDIMFKNVSTGKMEY